MSQETEYEIKRLILLVEQLTDRLEQQAEENRKKIERLEDEISILRKHIVTVRTPSFPEPRTPTDPYNPTPVGDYPYRPYLDNTWTSRTSTTASGSDQSNYYLTAEQIQEILNIPNDVNNKEL